VEAMPLESILATAEFAQREAPPDFEAENRALSELARELPTSSAGFLQKLSDVAMRLCEAHSAGVSILEHEQNPPVFRWHAVSGRFAPHLWGTMLRELSPCGTVVDLGATQLMISPERHFTALRGITPPVVEAVLAPLQARGRVIGTVWVLSHEGERRFTRRDAHAIEALAALGGPVYALLTEFAALAMGGKRTKFLQ
jgi:two-component system, cell cycle sensor histidine kinase and response regulator CckA